MFFFTSHFFQTAATDLRQTFHVHAPRLGLRNIRLRSPKSVWCRYEGWKCTKISIFDRSTLPLTNSDTAAKWERLSKPGVRMARADNFRTRQQLYKNPFIGGGIAWQQYFTFSPNCTFSQNCTFSGFLVVSSQWLRLQASNLVQLLISWVLTRKLTFIPKGACPGSHDLHLNFHTPLIFSNRWRQTRQLWYTHWPSTTCPNRKN